MCIVLVTASLLLWNLRFGRGTATTIQKQQQQIFSRPLPRVNYRVSSLVYESMQARQ